MDEYRTKRLRWRQPRASDVDAYMAFVSDYEVVKWTATWPHPAEREFVASRCVPVAPELGFAGPVFLGDEMIGGIGVIEGELGFSSRNRIGAGATRPKLATPQFRMHFELMTGSKLSQPSCKATRGLSGCSKNLVSERSAPPVAQATPRVKISTQPNIISLARTGWQPPGPNQAATT